SVDAVRRADAVAAAFLGFRRQVREEQLTAVVSARRDQESDLRKQVSSLSSEIQAFESSRASPGTNLDDLLSERSDLNNQIQQLDNANQADIISLASVVANSRVIDSASAVQVASRRIALVNAASGFVAGLAIALFVFTVQAIVTTRVRRRADIVK